MGLKIVFASTAEGTQGTLVAFQACVDDHVSLPVALAFDYQSTHRTLEWFAAILRRALRTPKDSVTIYKEHSEFLKSQSSVSWCVEVCCRLMPLQIQTTVFTDLKETTPHLMVKTVKGNASWKQWNNGSKNSSMF